MQSTPARAATSRFRFPENCLRRGIEAALRESLEALFSFDLRGGRAISQDRQSDHVPAIVIGVIERFVEPDLRAKLKDADDDLRLIEDLGSIRSR